MGGNVASTRALSPSSRAGDQKPLTKTGVFGHSPEMRASTSS